MRLLRIAEAAIASFEGGSAFRQKTVLIHRLIFSYLGIKAGVDPKSKHHRARPYILLILQGASWARDFLTLAKALAATQKYEIEVGINFAGMVGDTFRQQCVEIGVRCFMLDRRAEPKTPAGSTEIRIRPSLWRNRFSAVLKRVPLLRNFLIVGYHILRFQKHRIEAVRLIAAHNPRVMVISGYSGFQSAFLVKEAVRCGASVLRLDTLGVAAPAWRAAWRDSALGHNVAVSTFARKLLATIFPKWTYRFADGRRIFYDTPVSCITAWLCGAMPKNPFAMGYGSFTAFTAIHEYSRRALEAAGIEPRRIHLIGRLQDDVAFSTVAKVLNNKGACLEAFGFDPQRPLILCSSAPFVEHNIMTAEEQRNYHEIMISGLATIKNAQIVLSIHPAQKDTKDIYEIAGRYGVRVLTSPGINELLPLATLYADGESTVGIMAAACGVPMILTFFEKQIFPNGAPPPHQREAAFKNFVASLHPPDRLITEGQVIVERWQDVAAVAQRCLNDHVYYATLVERQRKSARLWATAFDGKATERAVQLVDELCSRQHGR